MDHTCDWNGNLEPRAGWGRASWGRGLMALPQPALELIDIA